MSVDPGSRGWNEHRHMVPPLLARLAYPYTTGWQDYPLASWVGGYWVDSLGIVHMDGIVTTNTVNANTALGGTILTLPAGYRPAINQLFACAAYIGSYQAVRIDVDATGAVVLSTNITGTWASSATAGNSWVSLSGITFRTS